MLEDHGRSLKYRNGVVLQHICVLEARDERDAVRSYSAMDWTAEARRWKFTTGTKMTAEDRARVLAQQ